MPPPRDEAPAVGALASAVEPPEAVARVLIDSPLPQLDRLFDYAIPAELSDVAVPGVRVTVPLRTAGRVVEGYLIERYARDASVGVQADEAGHARPLSELDGVVSGIRVLPESLYALARKAADRAAGSASDILRLAIPKRMVRAEKAWRAAEPPTVPIVAGASVAWADGILAEFPGLDAAVVAGERLAVDAPPRVSAVPSTGEPVGAWAEMLAALAVSTLSRGQSAVLVLPDYRDQAQVLAVLDEYAPHGSVVRDDARRSGPERYAAYLRVLAPVPCIVIGNRSSVYAPAHEAGLVAMWDDGDPLLAEPLSPGVHARDAALIRQELDPTALVFVGHTRTTDIERLVQLGWVREVPAFKRLSPHVVLSAPREGESHGERVPSTAFAAARAALVEGPVLVVVSRPGYSPVLACGTCRAPARCAACQGPLRAARPGAIPDCGWCGKPAPVWTCPHCDGTTLRMVSSGSERTADELGRAFPGVRVIVSDGAHPVIHVDARPALVIATRGAEPIASGGYRAIILLDGDKMLLAEQLRIGEACLRWWSDAAALAAPHAPVHLVGVTGPVARALATWTQPAYARAELADRAPLLMPPTVRVAAVEGTSAEVTAALTQLGAAVPALTRHASGAALLGPVPIGDAGNVRALVRCDYAQGAAVAQHLRALVIAAALRRRKPPRKGERIVRNTLKVRLDVPELEL